MAATIDSKDAEAKAKRAIAEELRELIGALGANHQLPTTNH